MRLPCPRWHVGAEGKKAAARWAAAGSCEGRKDLVEVEDLVALIDVALLPVHEDVADDGLGVLGDGAEANLADDTVLVAGAADEVVNLGKGLVAVLADELGPAPARRPAGDPHA